MSRSCGPGLHIISWPSIVHIVQVLPEPTLSYAFDGTDDQVASAKFQRSYSTKHIRNQDHLSSNRCSFLLRTLFGNNRRLNIHEPIRNIQHILDCFSLRDSEFVREIVLASSSMTFEGFSLPTDSYHFGFQTEIKSS